MTTNLTDYAYIKVNLACVSCSDTLEAPIPLTKLNDTDYINERLEMEGWEVLTRPPGPWCLVCIAMHRTDHVGGY